MMGGRLIPQPHIACAALVESPTDDVLLSFTVMLTDRPDCQGFTLQILRNLDDMK
jgi:hypothetical protein